MPDGENAPQAQEGQDRDQGADERLVEEAEPEPGKTLTELDRDPAEAEQRGHEEECGPATPAHRQLAEAGQQERQQGRAYGRLQASDTSEPPASR